MPCFILQHLLPSRNYTTWRLLSAFCRIIAAHTLTADAIDRCEELYMEFFRKWVSDNPDRTIPPNFHAALHVPDKLRAFGPSWSHWW